jgi:uncharacterized membrane protein YjjB (DUF3815 family)
MLLVLDLTISILGFITSFIETLILKLMAEKEISDVEIGVLIAALGFMRVTSLVFLVNVPMLGVPYVVSSALGSFVGLRYSKHIAIARRAILAWRKAD